jgi:hypothetical protein
MSQNLQLRDRLADEIFALSSDIRYVAIKQGSALLQRQRPGLDKASAAESDRYEELFVNPGLLALASARGDLDCGGLHHIVIRYGNFFQLVVPSLEGHLSVCIAPAGNLDCLVPAIRSAYERFANRPAASSNDTQLQEIGHD